jgi:hypothetical protein
MVSVCVVITVAMVMLLKGFLALWDNIYDYVCLLYVMVRNKLCFYGGKCGPTPNPQAGGPPLVCCPRLLIQYLRSYPPCLEVSSVRNLRMESERILGRLAGVCGVDPVGSG